MRRTSSLLLLLCGCGVSTAELNDWQGGPQAQTSPSPLDLERSRPPARAHDAGRSVDEPGGRDDLGAPDAGEPTPEPSGDAGVPTPEPTRDAGAPTPEPTSDAGAPTPEPTRDAGVPRECTPATTRSCATACGSSATQRCDDEGRWGTCTTPREVCDDGLDNDCDGLVDDRDPDCPPRRRRCEDTEGGGCNGDLGYGNRCAPSDNTHGCSASRFHAWCNRRNPAYPNVWDTWIRTWVASRCDGAVQETGGQYSTWYCVSSSNDRYECTTPLVLSFDGAPVRFEVRAAPFAYTPGRALQSDWPNAVTPWLARDLNGNGAIDDGSELFGSDTRLGARTALNGFEALAALDANHDGVVDAKDPAFSQLLLWRDVDGDKRTSPGELQRLSTAGVTSLRTGFTVAPRCDGRGNCERERGRFTTSTGVVGALVDVHLRTWRPAEPVAPSVAQESRPPSSTSATSVSRK